MNFCFDCGEPVEHENESLCGDCAGRGNMTIEEVTGAKKNAENQIRKVIEELEKTTGTVISDVYVRRYDTSTPTSSRRQAILNVEVICLIP